MIESFVFSEGRPVSHNLEMEALRLARADKGLILWIDLTNPTPEETKSILELLFEFHPLAIEDCVTLSELPKIEDYEDYLFMIMHSVAITHEKTLKISELNLFLGKEFLVILSPRADTWDYYFDGTVSQRYCSASTGCRSFGASDLGSSCRFLPTCGGGLNRRHGGCGGEGAIGCEA